MPLLHHYPQPSWYQCWSRQGLRRYGNGLHPRRTFHGLRRILSERGISILRTEHYLFPGFMKMVAMKWLLWRWLPWRWLLWRWLLWRFGLLRCGLWSLIIWSFSEATVLLHWINRTGYLTYWRSMSNAYASVCLSSIHRLK